MVGILRQLHRFFPLEELLIAYVERESKLLNLIAGVVHVEFTFDIISGVFQHGSQAVAQCSAACVSHMHGAGRVGGDEFHHDALAASEVGFAVVGAVPVNSHQNLAEIAAAHEEIDEAGTGDFHLFDECAGEVHALADDFGDLAGRHAECLGGNHCRVGSKISVRRIRGGLYGEGRSGYGGQHFVSHAASHCGHNDFLDLCVNFFYGIGHWI